MFLNDIQPGTTGVKKAKRVGRGEGSGKGKTCGRGQKGAGARKSPQKGRVAFEGGQMPLQRRLPKRGFKSPRVRDTQIVNLAALEKLEVSVINAEVLAQNGLVKSVTKPVKILGFGTISKPIEVKVNAISDQAKTAIEAVGGKVELI
jgi:large subunit ribosomal protein L15